MSAVLATPAAASTEDELTGVAGWAVDVMEALGAVGAGALILVETVFPPLPSELILPLAGFSASQGSISLLGAVVWTTLGSLLGAYFLYFLAAGLGRERCLAIWRRLPLVEVDDFEKAERWFERHGNTAVLLGRLLPGIRSLVSLPAGLARMPLAAFTLYTLIGSLVWNTLFILAGWALGEQWHRVEPWVGWLQWVVIATLVGGAAWWTVRRLQRRRHDVVTS